MKKKDREEEKRSQKYGDDRFVTIPVVLGAKQKQQQPLTPTIDVLYKILSS